MSDNERAYTISITCSGGEWGRCQGSLKVFGPIKYILCTWLWDSSVLFVSSTWKKTIYHLRKICIINNSGIQTLVFIQSMWKVEIMNNAMNGIEIDLIQWLQEREGVIYSWTTSSRHKSWQFIPSNIFHPCNTKN